MEKRTTEKSNLTSVKKSAFYLIIFPLIFATLLILILALTILLNGGKNPVILENWANISVILISLVLLLPGLLFLAIMVAAIFLLGKTWPVIEKGLMKTQIFAANFNNLIMAFIRMALYPFSIAKVLTQREKIEYPRDKESVDE